MKRHWIAALAAATFCVSSLPAAAATPLVRPVADGERGAQEAQEAEPEPAPLSEEHQKWLREEVGWIIAPLEKDVFERLTSDEERDLYIEAFWRTRDPTPGTARNEARDEHYQRLAYANRYLGQETPRRGWQTDRGRTYITLGEPVDIQRHNDPRSFWPMELWVYSVDPLATALPSFFYLLFYRPEQIQEFRLYDPFTDGVSSLAKQITLQFADVRTIVENLRINVGPEVAHAALNMNASEPTNFVDPRVSAGNAFVRRALTEVAYRNVDKSYAIDFLANRGRVDAIVDFSTMRIDVAAYGFWDERGLPFLHYAVQIPAERVLLGQYEDDFYVSLGVAVEVEDLRGQRIESGVQDVESHFDEEKMQRVVRAPLAYLDRVDLVPGVYDVSLRFDNRVSQERALESTRIRIPQAGPSGWTMSDLLVALTTAEAYTPPSAVGPRAFRFGRQQLIPSMRGRVEIGSEVTLFAQLAPGDDVTSGTMITPRAVVVDLDGNEVRAVQAPARPTGPVPTPSSIQLQLPTEGLALGPYRVRLLAELASGQTYQVEAPLEIVPPRGASVPEILMGGEAPHGDLSEYRTRATQHLRKGETDAAIAYLRVAIQRSPGAPELQRTLAQALGERGEYAEAIALLTAMRSAGTAGPGDLLALTDVLRLAGRPAEAAAVARELLARRASPAAWNRLGAALEAMGQVEDASAAYRASLQLDPDQVDIQEALRRLQSSR